MLDEGAVNAIANLAKKGRELDTLVGMVDGVTMSTRPLHHIPVKLEPEPAKLSFRSLQAFVDFMTENRDDLELAGFVVHVSGPQAVALLGPLVGDAQQRLCYAAATCKDMLAEFVGRQMQQDTFIVGLQTRFVETDDRAALLKLVGSIADESSVQATDDGRSQEVTSRAGVVLKSNNPVAVPNPVRLAGIRTFREIEQPDAPYILRVAKGPLLTLHEADGGAWELSAVQRVATWLRGQIKDLPVLA